MPRMNDLYSRWTAEVRRNSFVHAGERIGAAVSGGPDSVLLLDFLAQLSRDMGLQLSVVHFNHHLRGAESEADENFVRTLAARYGLPFYRGEARVAEEARRLRRNLEATARDLRYRYFLALVRQGKVDKVATAHTLDDQAETLLLHILRGTGTRGLGGIRSTLQNKIIRPFLAVTRAEIESEIVRRNLEFRVDSSNLDPRFRRNRVRMELLPMLEREYNPELKRLLSELAARSAEDEDFLEQQARERAGAWRLREAGCEKISRAALRNMPPALVRRVLRQMLQDVGAGLSGITHRHIEAVRHLAVSSQSGKRLELPHGTEARTEYEWLVLLPRSGNRKSLEFVYSVEIPGTITVREIGRRVDFKIIEPRDADKGYNAMEWPKLDPLKLPARLVFRNWRQGDRYCPLGFQKSVKVKELFQRQRIPLRERALWPVLDSEKGVVCARGFPAAAWAAAEKDSPKILAIRETNAA